MAENEKPKREERTVENRRTPDFGPMGAGGGSTPARTGAGMGVDTGDYTEDPRSEAPRSEDSGPGATVTVGRDTGQHKDVPGGTVTDVPPTPNADRGKRPLNRTRP